MKSFELEQLKKSAGLVLTESENKLLEADVNQVRQLIQQATVKRDHAVKLGNRKEAINVYRQLVMQLQELGYDWKRDPHVLELQPEESLG